MLFFLKALALVGKVASCVLSFQVFFAYRLSTALDTTIINHTFNLIQSGRIWCHPLLPAAPTTPKKIPRMDVNVASILEYHLIRQIPIKAIDLCLSSREDALLFLLLIFWV